MLDCLFQTRNLCTGFVIAALDLVERFGPIGILLSSLLYFGFHRALVGYCRLQAIFDFG